MQKVLIIGAGGIGSAVAREIIDSGGKVFLAGRNAESLQELASELNCDWGNLEATDAASVDKCSEKAFQSLDTLYLTLFLQSHAPQLHQRVPLHLE